MRNFRNFDTKLGKIAVGQQVALVSILGFWLFYVIVITLRAAIADFPSQGEMMVRRSVVTLFGIIITYALYLLLRRFDDRPFGVRVATAFIAALPCAILIASINFYVFNIYYPESLFDESMLAEMREEMATGNLTAKAIAEDATARYFFIVSWASLYLALSYAAGIQAMERRAARFAKAAQDAELRSLRYQVNPHFLFNTLNSLSALVMREKPQAAEEMILNLSKFYRTSLSGDPLDDVSLAEEVELQQLYLAIEQVRFPERLRTAIEIPDDCRDALVPGLILQPLVENAIKYGVSRARRPVTIGISARAEGRFLKLSVSDDGDKGTPGDPCESNGIGLVNVRDRLETRFGDEAHIQLSRPEGGGFVVELTMPLIRARATR